MLTKWKVSNFKSIREETELVLGPLTIFAGANSSGKSTFIQSILLVAQTLANKVETRSVVLNGALTSLGQFDDLKSIDGASDQISIACTCQPAQITYSRKARRPQYYSRNYGSRRLLIGPLKEVGCEVSFDADPSSPQRELFQIQPRLFSTQLYGIFGDEDGADQRADILFYRSDKVISEIEERDEESRIDEEERAGLAFAVELDEDSKAEILGNTRSAELVGCLTRHFLPMRIIYAYDNIEETAKLITECLQGPDSNNGIIVPGVMEPRIVESRIIVSEEIISVLRDVLKDVVNFDEVFRIYLRQNPHGVEHKTLTLGECIRRLREIQRKDRIEVEQRLSECGNLFDRIHTAMRTKKEKDLVTESFFLPSLISEASAYLDKYFASSLKYLGPLRDAPKPLYPLAPSADPYDVGLRGEHTASILELHKNKRIRYIPPVNFKSPEIDYKPIERTLETAVIDWLQYLGVANSVKSRDQGKLGHELRVGLPNSRTTHDLTHVGVGVSQVLPILVMCLLADADTTLVFEQPELHLHPKVQTLLGDFFLSMALCNKQCIVETHSEYLIDRLRFRIASAPPKKPLNSQAKIYFVEKPTESSTFREVVINEYGAIKDWPEGFFDQSQQQAEDILVAAAQKRKASRRNTDG
ncbi:MAG: DUF3696 domain-containing protein [Methylobacteriaceae bacterium]|jgi:predicted ATPase|nr:DUF3696 domain-containing protein [Methylobacteriaceae bacterium]